MAFGVAVGFALLSRQVLNYRTTGDWVAVLLAMVGVHLGRYLANAVRSGHPPGVFARQV